MYKNRKLLFHDHQRLGLMACSDSVFFFPEFMNLRTFGRTPGGSDRRKASTYTGQHNIEKGGHTSMPRVGFEPVIPVFERSKTVCALDRAAIGTSYSFMIIS
jgi:hypothetical protein